MDSYGPFHFFFSLSANEKQWPEVKAAILHHEKLEGLDKIVYEVGWETDDEMIKFHFNGWNQDASKIISCKKFKTRNNKFFVDNFMLITRIFDSRIKAFISKILCANVDIEHYSYRIEFQVRGMPHLHGVFWLSERSLKENGFISASGELIEAQIPRLVNKWVSCSLEQENEELNNLVRQVNCHKHTRSCRKGKFACRFSFPRLPSDETLVAKPLNEDLFDTPEMFKDELKKNRKILQYCKTTLESLTDQDVEELGNDLKKFIALVNEKQRDINITYDSYKNALQVSEKGQTVVLKRKLSERNVNNYNPLYMLAWRANMDIQFCNDNYAIVTYITDYITKADAG